MTASERRQRIHDMKDSFIERYLEDDQIEAFDRHGPKNTFFVKHQVVVAPEAADQIADRLDRFHARRVAPTVKLTPRVPPWQQPDYDASRDTGPEAVFVFEPGRSVDVVEFAYDPVGKRVRGVELNHLVTGFQPRQGWPDGDPETAPRPLPRMPTPRPVAGSGVRVAIVDTGYPARGRYSDPGGWFAPGSLDDIQGWDVVDDDRDGFLDVEAGHGLFVAGLIRRYAPSVEIVHLKALNSDGVGTELGVAARIREAADKGAHVINLSLGFYALGNDTQQGVKAAIEYAQQRDAVVVAAAGNDGIADPAFPAALPDVIGVGALSADGSALAEFSNDGLYVNVAAPGERVQSAYVGGRENPAVTADRVSEVFTNGSAIWSGTSFACAAVSGHLAAKLAEPDGDRSRLERARDIVEDLPVLRGVTRRLDPVPAF